MPRTSGLCVAMLAFVSAAMVSAQEAVVPTFDVTSVRPQEGDPAFVPSSPDRFVDVNATLRSLVTWAWNVRGFQVDGGPAWAESQRFDVSARSPRPVSEATMRLMVRQLLADRFQLKVRVERRQMPRYVLRAAHADGTFGPDLRPATIDCAAVLALRFGAPAPPGSQAPDCTWRIGISPPVARLIVDGAPMAEFAGLLERLLNRKVIDGTGWRGPYDIRLEFSSDQLPMGSPPADDARPAAPSRDGLSLFTALHEQLGLRLESERGPVDVLVIESAQRPDPN
jgi:uncharacterized protein (TIGR03435 family)